jgi:cobalt-precorrin 5A hydrolase
MIIAGIGCRRRVSAADVTAAIEAAVRLLSLPARPEVIALPEYRRDEAGVFAAAESLGVRVVLISQLNLERENARTLTHSARSLAETNVHSVSEAAALAAAGTHARLIAPRVAVGPVTCAIAESELDP